jgi:hypothetical protein
LGYAFDERKLTTMTPMTTGRNFFDPPTSDTRRFSGAAQTQTTDNPIPYAPKPPTQTSGIDLLPLLASTCQAQHGTFQSVIGPTPINDFLCCKLVACECLMQRA